LNKIVSMIIMSLLLTANSWAVVVTGSGTTKEEAINNGLREAVEMYTGAMLIGWLIFALILCGAYTLWNKHARTELMKKGETLDILKSDKK